MTPILWAFLLLIAGAFLLVLEFLVPSAGIIGVLAGACLLAAIIVGFTQGIGWGLGFLFAVLLGVPVVLAAMIRVWPYTPIGRRLFLHAPESTGPDELELREAELRELVGRTGVAKTPMLPAGIVVIDKRSYDAVADGEAVEAGEAVRVRDVRMRRLVVSQFVPLADAPKSAESVARTDPDDLLSRSLAELGLEPLETGVSEPPDAEADKDD